jgi:hypothetical protein
MTRVTGCAHFARVVGDGCDERVRRPRRRNRKETNMIKTARRALVGASIVAGTLGLTALPAGAHPHVITTNGQVIANGQNHAPFVNGVSCGGDPAAYGLETAHHGPDAGTPGRGDGCYQTTGAVPPGQDVANPVIG